MAKFPYSEVTHYCISYQKLAHDATGAKRVFIQGEIDSIRRLTNVDAVSAYLGSDAHGSHP